MKNEFKIDIKHPRLNNEFFGFKKIDKYFLDVLKKEKISNAYLFYGIKGLGKATFAYKLSKCILKNSNNLKSISSLNILNNEKINIHVNNLSHPDLTVIETNEENKKINFDSLKSLDKITYGTSSESKYKIIIIDSLDEFSSKKSFSSLLKLLEDCPKNCIFFLISHSLNKVPNTIKSRCQKIYFNQLSNELLKKWFQNSKLVDEKDINILINLANGSLGKALQVINNENFFNIYKEGEKIINNMANINKDEINNFFSLFDKNLEVDEFLKVIQIIIIQNIKNSFNENKNMDKKSVNAYISLFFEINKKLDKFKSFDLHDAQILETIKFIFIKHSENF